MANILDFIPLFRENIDTIRARVDADANMGLQPSDPRWLDLTQGGFYFDLTQPQLMEIERLWDAVATEFPAVAFVQYAYGVYLDEWGVAIDVPRKDAAKSAGTVRFTGTDGTVVHEGTRVAAQGLTPLDDIVEFETTLAGAITDGTVDLPMVAVAAGSLGNVAANTVTIPLTPTVGVTALTNPNAITGGEDVETDAHYQERLLIELAGTTGAGTIDDYRRWALAYPSVENVTVEPIWNGPGTVRLSVTDVNNQPLDGSIVTGLKNLLDPVDGQGKGLAPIGAVVTVVTPAVLPVTVNATITYEDGFSRDGSGGTIGLDADMKRAVQQYMDHLAPGEDVIFNHVRAKFFEIDGVHDVTALQLNGTSGNIAIATTEVAESSTITLAP